MKKNCIVIFRSYNGGFLNIRFNGESHFISVNPLPVWAWLICDVDIGTQYTCVIHFYGRRVVQTHRISKLAKFETLLIK